MSRGTGGFALLSVLWAVVFTVMLVSTEVSSILLDHAAVTNRILRVRAQWAAWACVASLQATYLRDQTTLPESVIQLSEGVTCSTRELNRDERINLNRPDSAGWSRVFGDSVAVASLMDWLDPDDIPRTAGAEEEWYSRRERKSPRNDSLQDVRELREVRGFESVSLDAMSLFTVFGDGRISPNRAPETVIASLGVLPPGSVRAWLRSREREGPVRSPEEFASRLDLSLTIPDFQEVVRRTRYSDAAHTVLVVGRSDGPSREILASLEVDLIETGGRLALVGVRTR